jgi:hypothetical protein
VRMMSAALHSAPPFIFGSSSIMRMSAPSQLNMINCWYSA